MSRWVKFILWAVIIWFIGISGYSLIINKKFEFYPLLIILVAGGLLFFDRYLSRE